MTLPAGRDFHPPWPLTNGHLQTLLSLSPIRHLLLQKILTGIQAGSQAVLVDAGDGVRLNGAFTPQKVLDHPRGLAVLFHGWEGSMNALYVLQTGSRLLREGWDVFRLDFRDHGDSHGLNKDLFHSCRIKEVVGAMCHIAAGWSTGPLVLAGFSLGGNFALRVAIQAPHVGIELAYILAVCPVIDPAATLLALVKTTPWFYQAYFMHGWRQSLRTKQAMFPQQFYFDTEELKQNMHELTETMVLRHTHFDSLQSYLEGYSITGSTLQALPVPATILAARDDPVIPVATLEQLNLPLNVELDITRYGGHCGFIRGYDMISFTDDYIAARFNAIAAGTFRPEP